MQWEYRTITGRTAAEFDRLLNEAATEGFEVVEFRPVRVMPSHDHFAALMRRQREVA